MNQADTIKLLFCLTMLSFLGWRSFVQIRYLVRRNWHSDWPTVDATLQRGAIGAVAGAKGASIFMGFMGYGYSVQGVRYGGFFGLYGDEAVSADCKIVLPARQFESDTIPQIRTTPAWITTMTCVLRALTPRKVRSG